MENELHGRNYIGYTSDLERRLREGAKGETGPGEQPETTVSFFRGVSNSDRKLCDSHLKPIVITALNTGMRKGEILSLTWDQVDLRHGFILLEVTKNGERREIPINQTVRETLESSPRHIRSPYVFWHGGEGKPYRERRKSFNSAVKRAGIKDFTFHDLRHTFASQLVMAGCDLKTVQELLGHKTLTMTLRYAHLAPSHKVKAVGILDTALRRGWSHRRGTS